MQAVRWSVGGNQLSLPGLALQYGDATAITLIDVVLFRREADAEEDAKLWAHELTHVGQYRRWGVEGFAARYVADSGALEREASDNADRFARTDIQVDLLQHMHGGGRAAEGQIGLLQRDDGFSQNDVSYIGRESSGDYIGNRYRIAVVPNLGDGS